PSTTPPCSPSSTLFRSWSGSCSSTRLRDVPRIRQTFRHQKLEPREGKSRGPRCGDDGQRLGSSNLNDGLIWRISLTMRSRFSSRSEEHTSELQSRVALV